MQKKIGILGLGITGQNAFEYLSKDNIVICYDDNLSSRQGFINKYGNSNLIDSTDNIWTTIDELLISPGIVPSHPLIQLANSHNIEIVSDIELFFKGTDKQIIGITGTNGKSTTTALIYHILRFNNLNYQMGGNIGKSVFSLPKDSDGYVLELSSYQLDLLKNIQLEIGIILNITPDHLERYHNMEGYINSKAKIFSILKQHGAGIINIDQDITKNLYNTFSNKNLFAISTKEVVKKGVAVIDGKVYDALNKPFTVTLPANKFLLGEHNLQNIAASYLACRILGVSSSDILSAISSFQGLDHRMQFIGHYKNMHFYNDSKATNADAAINSIKALNNIYWLAGGIGKADGVLPIIPYSQHITKAYLFGQDKELFAKTLDNHMNNELFDNLEDAFNKAIQDAKTDTNNVNILLAPAAASTDQFKNFEERGNMFITLYKQL